MVAYGSLPHVVFADEPKDVVAIDDAPDGGEGIAEADEDALCFLVSCSAFCNYLIVKARKLGSLPA